MDNSLELVDGAGELIEAIVKAIVDNPKDVIVENSGKTSSRHFLGLHTAQEDVKHVIGKGGSVIDSIRTILRVYGGKNKIKIEIDYVTEIENKNY